MNKNLTPKKNLVTQILDKAQLDYDLLLVNKTEGHIPTNINESDIYKTLALIGDKTGPIIGMVPITERLSEKKLAKASGNKKVAMVSLKELKRTTGYVHGANNPIGIYHQKHFPIFIDNSAKGTTFVCSAGEINKSIRISADKLADFVSANFVDLLADH